MTSPDVDASEDVNDFLLRIRELGEKRDKEDEERTKKLEEEILQGRKEREARRAGKFIFIFILFFLVVPLFIVLESYPDFSETPSEANSIFSLSIQNEQDPSPLPKTLLYQIHSG